MKSCRIAQTQNTIWIPFMNSLLKMTFFETTFVTDIFEMKEKNPEFRNRFQFFIGGEWWLVFFFFGSYLTRLIFGSGWAERRASCAFLKISVDFFPLVDFPSSEAGQHLELGAPLLFSTNYK